MRMDKYNLFTLGLVGGIILFFLGMILNIVLGPSTTSYQVPAQVSEVVKLSGMGIVCLSMILGSVFIEKIDRDTKVLLLIFGVILLLVNVMLMSTYHY